MPQGPRDIYLGISGAILGTIPTAFLYFTTYEWCKERLADRGHSQVLFLCAVKNLLLLLAFSAADRPAASCQNRR
jgi:hypothetical protein